MSVDDREFEELFGAELSGVVRAAFVVCHDTGRAEDLAQEAFLELLRHWGRVSHYDRPGAWVRRIAIRKAVQATKREARRSWFERRAAVSPATDEVSPVRADGALWAAVRSLPSKQRAVVALFYYEDLSVQDVAGVMGCSASTVKVHLHRARDALRTCVTPTGSLS